MMAVLSTRARLDDGCSAAISARSAIAPSSSSIAARVERGLRAARFSAILVGLWKQEPSTRRLGMPPAF
jgi:hypothetical protein